MKGTKKNILLLCGGGGTEHDISLISANYIEDSLKNHSLYQLIPVEICKDGVWRMRNTDIRVELTMKKELVSDQNHQFFIDAAIPCIHGYPGETGEIQALFELYHIPYFGSPSFSSQICFNKLNTKMWLDRLNVPNTPYCFLYEESNEGWQEAKDFFGRYGQVFVKATNQGSSVGCYLVKNIDELKESLKKAFQLSPYVIIEKALSGRELEISVYEFEGEVRASRPGEIICPNKFYTFEEKYSQDSKTKTLVVAPDIPEKTILKMRNYAILAFKGIKLRHLSRVDFFLTDDHEIYLNEINTFPGMTPISMFPKMMQNDGTPFTDFLISCLSTLEK